MIESPPSKVLVYWLLCFQTGQDLHGQPEQDETECEAGGGVGLQFQLQSSHPPPVLQMPSRALPPLLQLRLFRLHRGDDVNRVQSIRLQRWLCSVWERHSLRDHSPQVREINGIKYFHIPTVICTKLRHQYLFDDCISTLW